MDPFVKDSALPFLAPQPSRSDEERAREWLDSGTRERASISAHEGMVHSLISLITAVRAEATLAGAAAERERILMEIAEKSPEIAAAIRGRKP